MSIWVKPDVLAKLGLAVPTWQTPSAPEQPSIHQVKVGAAPAPGGLEKTYTVARRADANPEEFGRSLSVPTPTAHRADEDVARIELGALSYQKVRA